MVRPFPNTPRSDNPDNVPEKFQFFCGPVGIVLAKTAKAKDITLAQELRYRLLKSLSPEERAHYDEILASREGQD
jgi:hypothetical protein